MLTPIEEKVLGAIEKEECVQFLQDIVRIPSMSSNEQAVAEYIARRMREWGFQEVLVQHIEGHPGRANLIAWLRGKDRKPTLMTTSHMDTIVIDTTDRDQWVVDPFSAEVRDGVLYGRGCVDNKGGCTVMVMAAKAIRDAGVELPGDLLTGLVADEEGWMIGIKQFIKSGLHKQVDACITADNLGGSTIPSYRPGRTFGQITFFGTNAHSGASPWSGTRVNAIHKAAKFIAALAETAPEHAEHADYYGKSFWQILRIDGGWAGTLSAQNPDQCRVVFDARLVPGHDPEDAWRDLRALLERFQSEDPDFKAKVEVWDRRPGYKLDWEWPVSKAVASAYEEIAGKPVTYGGSAGRGTTDTHYLIYEGIPCATLKGPFPQPRVVHAANEKIPLDILVKNAQAGALAILRYFGL